MIYIAEGERSFNSEVNALSVADPFGCRIVSLYNTYAYPGLPIGPVCNMGEACIKAVLYPEVHDYYYFLADKSGAVHYAHDYSEHLANINTYYN